MELLWATGGGFLGMPGGGKSCRARKGGECAANFSIYVSGAGINEISTFEIFLLRYLSLIAKGSCDAHMWRHQE
jgi:hypothetical protein